jgi:hypothetical protein
MGIVLIAALTVPIITIIVVSILIKIKKPDEFWNWWISFISTMVSLMLGVAVGIFLFEYSQERTNLDNKERITTALDAELSDVYKELSRYEYITIGKKEQKLQTLVIKIDQIIVNEAIRSNLFEPNVTGKLLAISRNITMLNSSVEHYLAFLRMGAINNSEPMIDALKAIMANIERYKTKIKQEIEKLGSLLNNDYTK